MYIRNNCHYGPCPYYTSSLCPFCGTNSFRFPHTENKLTVSPEEIISSKEKIHEDLRIPSFKGDVDPKILEHINENVKNDILEFKAQMETAAEEEAEERKSKGKEFFPFEISNSYLVTYNSNDLLSLSLIYEQIINKQNSFIRTTYNYDLRTGRSMSLKNLFLPGSNYLQTINEKIKEKLQSNKDQYFPNSAATFKGIAEDQPYYLEDHNLVIFFKFSEIAPIASDIPVVRIPFSELRGILKPGLF